MLSLAVVIDSSADNVHPKLMLVRFSIIVFLSCIIIDLSRPSTSTTLCFATVCSDVAALNHSFVHVAIHSECSEQVWSSTAKVGGVNRMRSQRLTREWYAENNRKRCSS